MFETQTAARNEALIAWPVASWIPKMRDSGTTSTAPATIPSGEGPEPPSPPNFASTIRSLTTKTAAPINR